MTPSVPKGFRLAGIHCGIKSRSKKLDLALFASDRPCAAAGVYTTNLVHAAPVALDRGRTPGARIRVVACNSGNANACTGARGLRDAEEMARLAAQACGAEADQALVLSAGVIGEYLPLDRIAEGVVAAAAQLGDDEESLHSAARAMMTTDTVEKITGRTLALGGREVRLLGLAKGAAMIGPKMAAMLSAIMTDAALAPERAQAALREAIEVSFNCISVEGHMSTNDTVLLLANGAAGGSPLDGNNLKQFQTVLTETCLELARAIPADGEGATHLITVEISGCARREDALRIAKTVAESALVKTAIHGADPNWGRIVSAAGYAGVPLDAAAIGLRLNDFELYRDGAPLPFDAESVSKSIQDNRETLVQLSFREGDAAARFWTSDLTAEYVRLNADYHT